MDHAGRGKKALADSKYQEAIDAYTAALRVSPTSPDYLIQRSTAHQRAKNYSQALEDAERAVIFAKQRSKREAIIEAQFRRGCSLYSLERYGDAQFVFGVVKRMDEKHRMVGTWIARNDNELKRLDDGDAKKQCKVEETPDEPTSGAGEVKAPVTSGSNNAASAAPTTPQQTAPDKIRHEWYQSSDTVYFTLLARGVPQDKAQIDIQEQSLSISFPLASGASYDLTLDPLFAAVIPEKCIPRVLASKIEIILTKAKPGQKWSTIESTEPPTSASKVDSPNSKVDSPNSANDAMKQAVLNNDTTAGPVYPTSSKSGPKNWDKVVEEAGRDDGTGKGLDDDDEGGDEANNFFKKLYKDASPETQRAMMKSYTESNGTALSTNWDEVSKGRVETVPPDGMVAKPY